MAALGSQKRPLRLRVQSQERAEEVAEFCGQRDWHFIVGIEPTNTEDISDLERKLNPPSVKKQAASVERNDVCPCGSGKKYKKCCLLTTATC